MATSRNAFNEVRGLLNRMERSIDEARDRRLGKTDGSDTAGPERPDLDTVIGAHEDEDRANARPDAVPSEAAGSPRLDAPAAPPSENRTKYGRAQPLRRPPAPSGEWKN